MMYVVYVFSIYIYVVTHVTFNMCMLFSGQSKAHNYMWITYAGFLSFNEISQLYHHVTPVFVIWIACRCL